MKLPESPETHVKKLRYDSNKNIAKLNIMYKSKQKIHPYYIINVNIMYASKKGEFKSSGAVK